MQTHSYVCICTQFHTHGHRGLYFPVRSRPRERGGEREAAFASRGIKSVFNRCCEDKLDKWHLLSSKEPGREPQDGWGKCGWCVCKPLYAYVWVKKVVSLPPDTAIIYYVFSANPSFENWVWKVMYFRGGMYSALWKYSTSLNFATFCHISGFKHKDIKLYFARPIFQFLIC
jgi:hypothetical protein